MCEQHHRQTKHVDGLPDWTTPSLAAGVKTRDHVAPPVNFAWGVAPPKKNKTIVQEDRCGSVPSPRAVGKEGLPNVETLCEENALGDADDLSEQREEVRASSREMMARLSFSSADSFPLTGPGQATREAVRPLSLPRDAGVVKPTESATAEKPAAVEVAAQRFTPTSARLQAEPKPFIPSGATSSSVDVFPRTGARGTTQYRTTDPPQRRKKLVQFADRERSYRKHQNDLTYHEAVQALASRPSREAQHESVSAARTTYQETYQWPRREHLVSMDKVGGQTAGGPTRYEPRRVFTAEDAMRVANESRLEFQPRSETRTHEAPKLHTPLQVAETKRDPRQDTAMAPQVSSPHVPEIGDGHQAQAEIPQLNATPPVSRQVVRDVRLSGFDAHPFDQESPRELSKPTPNVPNALSDGHRVHQDSARTTSAIIEFPRTPPTFQDAAVATSPICLHEVSTQTEPLKKTSTRKQLEQTTPAYHTGYCSHCGRNGEPAAVPANPSRREEARASNQTLRARRSAPISNRHNPIFTNARFPPEPPVFRSKTTYATEFGNKRRYRR
jgi:hypothetical protein